MEMDVMHGRCERFLAQVQAHHRAGDYYPDPWVVGAEAGLGREDTEVVVAALRERGWLGRSPYDTERVRITPRGWERLRRERSSGAVRVDRVIGAECVRPTHARPALDAAYRTGADGVRDEMAECAR